MNVDEASKKVWEDTLSTFEGDAMKSLSNPEDRQAFTELINDWRRLGEPTLKKLSLNQPWNMPLYFALSAAVLNRREINELKKLIQG